MATNVNLQSNKSKTASDLRDGIPRLGEYLEFLLSDEFQKVENYSDKFISEVGDLITSYNRKWVKDPLHQWSRQWEYPYVISQVQKMNNKNAKILDIGAGVTFLPYYLKDVLKAKSVVALDYDKSLEELYEKVNRSRKIKVDFLYHDIRELKTLGSEMFDYIYSVSVLEHTNQYDSIIKQCHKLLKPGGKLSLTFDVSLNGHDDIPLVEAKKLLGSIDKTFKNPKKNTEYLNVDLSRVITSQSIGKLNKKLMPWKYPLINTLKPAVKLQGLGTPYKKLTFCCVTVEKL